LIDVFHSDVVAVLLVVLDGQVTARLALGAFAVPPRRAAGGQFEGKEREKKEKRKKHARTYQT
jgi:hypothetical protein